MLCVFCVMLYFIFFDKWRRVQKKYLTNNNEKILMLCADEALKPPD